MVHLNVVVPVTKCERKVLYFKKILLVAGILCQLVGHFVSALPMYHVHKNTHLCLTY